MPLIHGKLTHNGRVSQKVVLLLIGLGGIIWIRSAAATTTATTTTAQRSAQALEEAADIRQTGDGTAHQMIRPIEPMRLAGLLFLPSGVPDDSACFCS